MMSENFESLENLEPPGRPRKITIIYNRVGQRKEGLTIDNLADMDTLTTALDLEKGLKEAGFDADLFDVSINTFAQLAFHPTDIFFNSCFGIGNLPKTEHLVVQALDDHQRPYTGGDGRNIFLTTDKFVTKTLLRENGIMVPLAKTFDHPGQPLPRYLKFPLIVKPSQQDGSVGISNKSVVNSKEELYERIAHINKWYHEAALVEEYIEGREINVAIIGNQDDLTVFPLSEITFGQSFRKKGLKTKWKVVSFAAKWLKNTKSYQETEGICPAPLPKDWEDQLKKSAKKAFALTGCRDYARVDFRVKNDGSIYLLEINANPAIDNDVTVGFVRSAKAFGLDYPALLGQIISLAWQRYQEKSGQELALKPEEKRPTVSLPNYLLP